LKLLSQLFGDRALIANATGCSSIYGGNLPTTPWAKDLDGRGPAWSNSLFEDNAEFGLGFRMTLDKQTEYASELLRRLTPDLVEDVLHADQSTPTGIYVQRQRVAELKQRLSECRSPSPIPESRPRCCAFPNAWCRSGTCRRLAAR
jgi:pyruvate-ferredoxin/flavodoxin oxidoreductase